MYCLSVPIEEEWRGNFVIKGEICSGDHVFNGRSGQAFNLNGKPYPAQSLRFKNRVLFRLRSGSIDEEVETSTLSEADDRGFSFGGYYDGDWNGGIGVCLLKNHVPSLDGQQIEISVKFELPAPYALIAFELPAEDDDEASTSMEIDEDCDGDHPLNQLDKIIHDAENCSEDDDSFNVDDLPTDDIPTDDDDEFEYDVDSDEDLDDFQMKQRGYKPKGSTGTLGEDSKALLIWREGQFSDWKIKVLVEREDGSENVSTYNVHRATLATA